MLQMACSRLRDIKCSPMFSVSPSFSDWKAMPTHSPLWLNAGPPLLPPAAQQSLTASDVAIRADGTHHTSAYCPVRRWLVPEQAEQTWSNVQAVRKILASRSIANGAVRTLTGRKAHC